MKLAGEQVEVGQKRTKFAAIYIPGAMMLAKSMNPIRAYIRQSLADYDLETRTWSWNPYKTKEDELDNLKAILDEIPQVTERRLIIVGESFGLDLAIEFRQRHNLEALVIGSSPGATMLHGTIEEQLQNSLLDQEFYRELFENDVGRAIARNWFKWEDPSYVHPAPYSEQNNLIAFTGVKIDNPTPRMQTRLNQHHLKIMHEYPGIMSINFDGSGHRVLLLLAPLIALTCRPYILDPDLETKGQIMLANALDSSLFHPMGGLLID